MADYQDYVIKDGRLVGDFEGLYRDFDDPWLQSSVDDRNDSRRHVAVGWCERLRHRHFEHESPRVLEIGCGFGHLTDALRRRDFSALGVDVSTEAIRRARAIHPSSVFMARSIEDSSLLIDTDPDVVLMSEVTWYVLGSLSAFVDALRRHAAERSRPTHLIHLLTTYAPGVQQYGCDFFTDLDGILSYFDLEYLEAGSITMPNSEDPLSVGTYFVAQIPR